ncbi:toll/interleukin-1 receptor domain-containing protein [Vibrio harveyi]|uniref:toll/interleukin-1 receptor domain-containing protein n=1 Tax=Vibrio harveyi TaxID=669 RepID=UPI003CF6D62F|nr:toll/interleukin-1 receptor domain-containing protein [Vibrio harveyi]
MAISESELRSAANRARKSFASNSLNEAFAKNQQTAFLCHSHKDHTLAKGLQNLLNEQGWEVYIDWLDEELPSSPNKETAEKIKLKIAQTDWFLFLATHNSTSSRWCPWEIGYADSVQKHEKIIVIPTVDDNGRWHGNEYLQLYRKLTDASNSFTNKKGYAVFEPNMRKGGEWVDDL